MLQIEIVVEVDTLTAIAFKLVLMRICWASIDLFIRTATPPLRTPSNKKLFGVDSSSISPFISWFGCVRI